MSDSDTIANLLEPTRSFIAKTRSAAPLESEAPTEADEYAAFSHGRVGRRPQMMIAFQKATGQIEVFPYSMLSHVTTDDRDCGFTLTFGAHRVTINGRNLASLFRYVSEHRVLEILEADRANAMGDRSAAVVTSIEIASGNREHSSMNASR